MRAINHKLQRELWQMRGQAMAIALVIASGIATYVMSLSTLESLLLTRNTYYRDYRFAEVFASLKRAPESLASRIGEIPGVARVETRVVASVSLDVAGFADPVSGVLVSVPDFGEPLLNRLYLRQGRMVQPERDDEAVVHEAFAQAHGLKTGDTLRAFAGIHLSTRARQHRSRLQALRRPMDGAYAARERLRHGICLQ